MNRRHLLKLATGCILGGTYRQVSAAPPATEVALNAARERLIKAGIGSLTTVRSAHFQAIGDSTEWFMGVMLRDCEQITSEYFNHFRARGFRLQVPKEPLIVIILRNDQSYDKFLNLPSRRKNPGVINPDGTYDQKTNTLHMFDWRGMGPHSGHNNAYVLVHELTHQLTFNTGLLNRDGDVPACIGEGLGMYGEARETIGPSDFGRVNWHRLETLVSCLKSNIPWISLRDLLSDDNNLRAGRGAWVALAYGESWLLTYYFLRNQSLLPKYREYLQAIQSRRTADHRIEDAQTHLGDLDQLDRVLQPYAIRLERPRH